MGGGGVGAGWRSRWGARLLAHRLDLLTLAMFAAFRALSTVWLVEASRAGVGGEADYWAMVGRWDGGWYREIATHGYPPGLPDAAGGRPAWSAWGFLPLYPALVRLAMTVAALPFETAATVVSVAAGGVAAVLTGRLLRDQVGQWPGLLATLVACAAPAAPVLQVAYTESLALALLAGFLLAVVRRRYWYAAASALLLALTRPIALPLAAVALTVAALEWRAGRLRDPAVRLSVAGLVAACGLAGVAWPAIVAVGTGRPDGYAVVGSAWWPAGGVRPFGFWAVLAGATPEPYLPLMLLTGAPLVPLCGVLALGPWARRLAAPLRVWCVAYALFLTATVQVTPSIWRYLLMVVPLPAMLVGAAWAGWGTRRSPAVHLRWVAALAVVWTVVGIALQQLWVRLIFAGSGFIP